MYLQMFTCVLAKTIYHLMNRLYIADGKKMIWHL